MNGLQAQMLRIEACSRVCKLLKGRSLHQLFFPATEPEEADGAGEQGRLARSPWNLAVLPTFLYALTYVLNPICPTHFLAIAPDTAACACAPGFKASVT